MASVLPGQEVGPAITINEASVFVPQPFSANLDFAKAVAGAAPSIGNPQAFAPGRCVVVAVDRCSNDHAVRPSTMV